MYHKKIKLQELFDHTVSRILLTVWETKNINTQNKLVLINGDVMEHLDKVITNKCLIIIPLKMTSIFIISLLPIIFYN